jgi:hypothetical protein
MTARRVQVALWHAFRLLGLALWWTLWLANLIFSAACSFASRVSARTFETLIRNRD